MNKPSYLNEVGAWSAAVHNGAATVATLASLQLPAIQHIRK
ncbi:MULTISPECIES: hypothetical protein [unclassified Bacillus (in: firmicutes)]|nr:MULTISPECIES: hypothetical protein [unclassified Bacillus (in: firmicutes)]